MKPLIFATLAMCWLTAPALAQQSPQPTGVATAQTDLDPRGNLAGPHTNQTSGGEADNPAPHIYKRGEHLSRGYGAFDDVANWEQFRLTKPPQGFHWVRFDGSYLLVNDESGLITDIVKAS